MTRKLPPSASVATGSGEGKLFAPSAARNVDALTQMLTAHAPQSGTALEIASGTGQHIAVFAKALPALHWQPTEIDHDRRVSIDAHAHSAGVSNIASAIHLNATSAGWSGDLQEPLDLIFLSNLLHLISTPETRTLLTEAALALSSTGKLIVYGPFIRDGQLTSDGDRRFDADLRASDPSIGYKDTKDMRQWLSITGLDALTMVDMPANNLALIATRGIT